MIEPVDGKAEREAHEKYVHDRSRPNVSFQPQRFVKIRDLVGRARVTWCGFLPLVGTIQNAIRTFVGVEDCQDALFRLDARCRVLEAENDKLREQRVFDRTWVDSNFAIYDQAVLDVQGIRKDLDADQAEYATERAADIERLALIEVNVQKVSQQNGALAGSLNGVTMLCLSWREVPMLKRAERAAQARRERQKAEQAVREAEAVKSAAQNDMTAPAVAPQPAESD